MVGDKLKNATSATATQAAVRSLQANHSDAVKAKRKHRRFEINTKVIVHPSDCIDRGTVRWLGECHDVSSGGCRLLTKRPLQLGSVYWVQFETTAVKLDPVFARCVRGQLLRENAFEFGMCFLTPIELPEPEDAVEADFVF